MPRQEPGEAYYRVSIAEAAEMYGSDDVTYVDVRRPDEYKEGHIEGALFIPHEEVYGRIDELPRDKKLLFVCAQGVRSGVACEMAAALGIDIENLYNIEEGTDAWISAGHPTSRGDNP